METIPESRCECDYDGDSEGYHKTSHYCPEHDDCEQCDERKGVMQDPMFDKTVEKRPAWVCEPCAKENIEAEMLRKTMEVIQ